MFPFYPLHGVRVVGHVLPDPDLPQGVPVPPVGALKFLHQVHQSPKLQRLEHEVLPAADAQRAEASPTVDSQHDVVEVVPWELRLEAEGEALDVRHVVGEVAVWRRVKDV